MTTQELDTENEKINTELKSKTTNFKSQVKLVNEGHSITSFILLKCKTIKLKHFFQYFLIVFTVLQPGRWASVF